MLLLFIFLMRNYTILLLSTYIKNIAIINLIIIRLKRSQFINNDDRFLHEWDQIKIRKYGRKNMVLFVFVLMIKILLPQVCICCYKMASNKKWTKKCSWFFWLACLKIMKDFFETFSLPRKIFILASDHSILTAGLKSTIAWISCEE